ncbi:TIFY [Castilleja foliolosa]|uniref:Protein TIFY n=1 Tax=Castilleja foliolosa TaxID=1961234 RepID=A0ABD3E6V0_9LAMI
MPTDGTTVKSALDKPLNELTEDEIAQITREDCRRYLKEKGMRRPSWNKSQAIQQVIMLKALLETTPDSGRGSQKRIRFSRPHNNNIPDSGTHNDAEDSMSVGETEPYCRKDLDRPDSSSGCLSSRFLAVNNDSVPPRITGLPSIPIGQMTIFYCGKVNVYDGMPEDKARSILNIAANPVQIKERPVDGTMMTQSLTCLSKALGPNENPDSAVLLPTLQKVESSSKRKASVQRYLDKKKDRFKSKRKPEIRSCASVDMYFNHHIRNEPWSRSNTCSPLPQIRPSLTPNRWSSVVNDSLKNVKCFY